MYFFRSLLIFPCFYLQVASRRSAAPTLIPRKTSPSESRTTIPPSFDIQRRQTTARVTTCGYYSGDLTKPRTAEPGFACRVDTANALWGFCPNTVNVATDCGLAGACVDNHDCTSGCGIRDKSTITTFSCTASGADFCSSALLTAGVDQTYTYIACNGFSQVDHIVANPTGAVQTTTLTPNPPKPTTTSPSSTPTFSPSLSSSPPSSTGSPLPSPTPSTSSIAIASVTSPSASSQPTSSSSNPNNTPTIVGGVIGGLALLCVTIIAIVFLLRRRSKQRKAQSTPRPDTGVALVDYTKDNSTVSTVRYHPPGELSNANYWSKSPDLTPAELSIRSPAELPTDWTYKKDDGTR